MTNNLTKIIPVEQVFYLSPTQKVHSQDCRHCRPDSQGWTLLDSFEFAIKEGYQTCRLCCPPLSEFKTTEKLNLAREKSQSDLDQEVKSSSESQGQSESDQQVQSSSESQAKSESDQQVQSSSESQAKSESPEDNQKEKTNKNKRKKKNKETAEKKRYKILAGNGCHQAIAEVKAMLVRPSEEAEKFRMILPDGLEIEATFKNPRLKWLAYNNDTVIGLHWFLGYPKMSEGKLVCFQIIAWDGDMPTSPKGWEKWEFTGLWTAQKNLTVQRSMTMEDIRAIAKESGFIKKFKYSFSNSQEWVKRKKLWIGYVYKLLCRREGDTLKIQKVIPIACPRIKPVIPGKGNSKGKTKDKVKDNSPSKSKPQSNSKKEKIDTA